MKKLRMIVTSVVVLAIVGSAFAFKVKSFAWCVTSNLSGTNCTTYILNKKIVNAGGTQYKFYAFWDGNPFVCTANNNGLCNGGPLRFTDN